MKPFYTFKSNLFCRVFVLALAFTALAQTPATAGCPFAKISNFFKSFSGEWGVKIYENPNYHGQDHIFKKGQYYAGKHCHSPTGISYKVNRGYKVFFYNKHGRLVKSGHRSCSNYAGEYHRVEVKYIGYHGNGHPTASNYDYGWYDDWKCVIYREGGYKGKYQCFRKPGKYYSGRHFPKYQRCSFKVRKGYQIWFYDRYGKCVKRAGHDEEYYDGGFHKFEVKHVGYERPGPGRELYTQDGAGYDHNYYEDWKFVIYYDPHYKGKYQCFRQPGKYYSGRHCPKSYGSGFSYKVRKGYEVWFYDEHGRCFRRSDHNDDYWNKPFHRFEVKKVGYSGGGSSGDGYGKKVGYDDPDWKCVIYDDAYYRGKHRCFKTGEYYGGRHCPNYYRRGISFKVRKGYQVWFYDKYGDVIKKAGYDEKYYNKGFHRFVVRKVG